MVLGAKSPYSVAKLALSKHTDISDKPLTFPSCNSLILKQAVARWQDHWVNSTTDRATYEMIPVVGYKTTYPRNRCIAVSYARLLLHGTSLRDHQYRLGLQDTRLCECGQGIEDDYDFFFECTRYTDSRNLLIQAVQDVWSHAGYKGVPRWSVKAGFHPTQRMQRAQRTQHSATNATYATDEMHARNATHATNARNATLYAVDTAS